MAGSSAQWHDWLPIIQLSMNIKYLERTGFAPFSLIHDRPFNGFVDYSSVSTC